MRWSAPRTPPERSGRFTAVQTVIIWSIGTTKASVWLVGRRPASIAAFIGRDHGSIYATAKAAVHEYTRCLAAMLRPHGVYANAVKETHWLSYPNYAALVSGSSFRTDDLADGHTDVFINLDLKTLETHAGLARVIIGAFMNAIYNRNGAIDARNMARFYALSIEPTLFGDVCLIRRWGRIATHGQMKAMSFSREDEAMALFAKIQRQKARRGYRERII